MKETRVGVYICNCGVNIAKTVNVKDVAEYASHLPGVVIAKDYIFTCSDPGQELIRKDIKELGLNRIVVAACSPHMHEKTFRRVLRDTGINPYFLRSRTFANIAVGSMRKGPQKRRMTLSARQSRGFLITIRSLPKRRRSIQAL